VIEIEQRSISAIAGARRHLQVAHSQYHKDEMSVRLIGKCSCGIAEAWRRVGEELSERELDYYERIL
jgi:hypothetical protein